MNIPYEISIKTLAISIKNHPVTNHFDIDIIKRIKPTAEIALPVNFWLSVLDITTVPATITIMDIQTSPLNILILLLPNFIYHFHYY